MWISGVQPCTVWPAHRRINAVIAALLLFAAGAALLVAGPVMVLQGRAGRGQIQHELAEQKNVFPQIEDLPTARTLNASRVLTHRCRPRRGEPTKAVGDHTT